MVEAHSEFSAIAKATGDRLRASHDEAKRRLELLRKKLRRHGHHLPADVYAGDPESPTVRQPTAAVR